MFLVFNNTDYDHFKLAMDACTMDDAHSSVIPRTNKHNVTSEFNLKKKKTSYFGENKFL